MKTFFCFNFFLLISLVSFSQDNWDLESCINYALENNLTVKQSQLNNKIAEENLVQAQGTTLPSLNGFATHFYNFGQTIDPFTNQFATTSVRSNQMGVQASLDLFKGFSNYNTIKQSQYDLMASQSDFEKAKNDISLNIAAAYLQILFNQELVASARLQTLITQKQVERTQKLVDAGTLPQGNLFQVQAQLASEELTLIQAQNNLNLSYLNLKQLLQLDSETEFKIVTPNLAIAENETIEVKPGMVYDKALTGLPEVKSAENRVLSAEHQVKAVKSNYYPSLTLSGSIGSGYSGLNSEVISSQLTTMPIGTTVSGELVTTAYQIPTETRVKPFSNQLSDNFNQSVGVTLRVPIFNKFQVNSSAKRAKLNLEAQNLQLQQTKNQIKQTIEQAYADANAALNNYRANQKAVEALTEAFRYTEQRFNVGMVNMVDYTDAKNRLARAESDLLRAQFDYVFKLKILDFYQGKPLTLKK